MSKRFELYLYDGAGRGKSEYFDHLEDLMVVATKFVDGNAEMTSQFEAYDNGKEISHNVGMFIMESITNPAEPIEREVRIKFSASVYIKGKTMREIREKWENCELIAEDTDDVFHEFDERLLVEDAKTYEDLSEEFDDYQ
jgi:hypothetical protein